MSNWIKASVKSSILRVHEQYVPIKRILDRVFKKVLFSDYSTNPKSERYFKKFETAASI